MRCRVQVQTPDAFVNAGVPFATAAVDGLWRADLQDFVHGAMAWMVGLVGWRSEYGATVTGHADRVAMEGMHWLRAQVKTDPVGHNRSVCKTSVSHLSTEEDPDSRFHGIGAVDSRHYDMQSQMFVQQVCSSPHDLGVLPFFV